MKRIRLIPFATVLGIALNFVSCSKENNQDLSEIKEPPPIGLESENPVSPNLKVGEKVVSYALSGNFSGKLNITFASNEGYTPPDQVLGAKIPWTTNFSVPEIVYAIGGYANGFYRDAKIGETASLKMYYDGRLIETVVRTADEKGINLPLEGYYLEFDEPDQTVSPENIGKEIQYNIKGDYSGTVMIVYKEADGSRTNIEISKFPWSYTFETTEESARVSVYGPENGGIEGETLTSELLVDGEIAKSQTATTDKEGGIGIFPEMSVDFD